MTRIVPIAGAACAVAIVALAAAPLWGQNTAPDERASSGAAKVTNPADLPDQQIGRRIVVRPEDLPPPRREIAIEDLSHQTRERRRQCGTRRPVRRLRERSSLPLQRGKVERLRVTERLGMCGSPAKYGPRKGRRGEREPQQLPATHPCLLSERRRYPRSPLTAGRPRGSPGKHASGRTARVPRCGRDLLSRLASSKALCRPWL